jgi:hypothetical protein
MEKIFATHYEATSRLVELPTELTIDMVTRVAAQSEDANVDLCNLRASCKAMCVVGGATTVGRRLALKRILRRRFYLGPEYRATLINTLASVGNREALFQSGLRHAVLGNTRGVIMLCLDQLRCAAEAGHNESMYALSLFLYRPNSGEADDDEATWLLCFVEGPVDGILLYQSSYGFSSGQIHRRSQGTLFPSSGEPKVSNPWNNVQRKDSI